MTTKVDPRAVRVKCFRNRAQGRIRDFVSGGGGGLKICNFILPITWYTWCAAGAPHAVGVHCPGGFGSMPPKKPCTAVSRY